MAKEATSKKIIHVSRGPVQEFPKGAKATFHFKVWRECDGNEIVIDDSRAAGKPMELLLGKQFKMPVLEQFLLTMRVGEVSRFSAIRQLIANYPFISQAYRRYVKGTTTEPGQEEDHHSGHSCGMSLNKGLGHPDLDQLLKNPPAELFFIIELLRVEQPDDYEKEIWQMEASEHLLALPRLKEEGNALYKNGQTEAAAEKYGKALAILEQLLLKEKPGDEEWQALDKLKVPLLSNFAQCKLIQKDYYTTIEHLTEVLKREPDNVKALFRRAKAHSAVWNLAEAKTDYNRVRKLDETLDKAALKEIKALDAAEREKNAVDSTKFKGKMF